MSALADEASLRRAICETAKHLYERGHNAPGDGNISARLSAAHLLTTPTMRHKGRLQPKDIVKVDAATGEGLDGQPSSELKMHLELYRLRPDISAIVHAHSPYAVALSVAGVSLSRPVVPEAIAMLGGAPTVPYATPTTSTLADGLEAHIGKADAFILERHGPVGLGTSVDEACARLEVLEHTAKITAIAKSVGSAEPIGDAEYQRLLALVGRA